MRRCDGSGRPLESLETRYNPSPAADLAHAPAWVNLLMLLRMPAEIGLLVRRDQNLSAPEGYVEEGCLYTDSPRPGVLTGQEAIRKAVVFAYRELSADVSDLALAVEAYQDLEGDTHAKALRKTAVWAELCELLGSTLLSISVTALQLGAPELVRVAASQRLGGNGANVEFSVSRPAEDWADLKAREFYVRPEDGSASLGTMVRDVFTQMLNKDLEGIAA